MAGPARPARRAVLLRRDPAIHPLNCRKKDVDHRFSRRPAARPRDDYKKWAADLLPATRLNAW
jgi:hypothetical protein